MLFGQKIFLNKRLSLAKNNEIFKILQSLTVQFFFRPKMLSLKKHFAMADPVV